MDVFDARLSPFSLESIVSLTAALTRRYFADPRKFRADLTKTGREGRTVFNPFLLRRVVTQAIMRRQLPDTADKTIDARWLAEAERVLFDAMSGRGAPGEAESTAMRALQDQYHDQSGYDSYIRELWLNLETIRLCLTRGLDLDAAYEAHLGLSYSELAFFSFAAYATVMGDKSTGALDPRTWLSGVGDRLRVRQGAIDAYFNRCSLSIGEFAEEARQPHLAEPGFEIYTLSPLIWAPLIRRSNGTCVAPIARDLLERPTRSFLIDALQSVPHQAGIISDASGEAYEQYVGESLRSVLPASTVAGREVLPRDVKNCDFVCIESQGVILVEAKSARLRLRADVTKDRNVLKQELQEKGVGHGLAQLDFSARQIRSGSTQLPNDVRIVALLVVRGELVLLNWPLIRTLLEEIATNENGFPVTVEYQIVNDESFSSLIQLRTEGGSIVNLLHEKGRDAYHQGTDLSTVLSSWRKTSMPTHPLRVTHFARFTALLERYGVQESDLESSSPAGSRRTVS